MILLDIEMPKGCWYSTKTKLSGVTTCPLITYCREKHLLEKELLDERPKTCPLHELEESLTTKEDVIKSLKSGYHDSNLQAGKDDHCVIDAMIDWAIRKVKGEI